ncbi:MAG: hypothetical protein FWG44_02335 [Oscillospiraceae bacterium]|nr:hypothetical protein [Oscillospiraceae bacterium]
MSSSIEIRTTQKAALFDLLMLKKEMEKEKNEANLKALEIIIVKTKTVMEAEDVAYVEKMIAQL